MYLQDVMNALERRDARQAVYKMLRQGLTNAAAIPEVETEPEQAAHHLLGCDNYLAMVTTYATAEDLRKDEPSAAAVIVTMCDEHLMLLTDAILAAQGAIGKHKCQYSQREPQ